MTSLFPDLPDCNLDMVLDLLCSVATAGGGGVGIPSDVAVVSSSGMVGHEVKVLLPASDNGVIEAPGGACQRVPWLSTLHYVSRFTKNPCSPP